MAGTSPVFATPSVSDKRDEARRVKAQLDQLDKDVEVAAEAHNEARSAHERLLAEIEQTGKVLAETNARIDELQSHLQVRASSMYRGGPVGFLEVLLGTNDFQEFASTWDLLKDMNAKEAEDVASLKDERAKAERYRTDLEAKESEARAVREQMAARKSAIEAKLAERKRMLAGLENEIAAIERAEAARAAAAARAAVSRSTSTGSRTFPPPTRAPRSEVVSIAKRYLGAPYRWGASGPNAFDCSGFTSFVYRQVGVSLPHSSRAQINVGQRVSRADLQPGDLVFFGSPIHHVGIYVGGGSYIHAPRTGDVVKISPLTRGDYAGATRP